MLLKPTYFIDGDITRVDIDRLYQDGIRGLILDLDSTIMAPKSGAVTLEATEWLDRARTKFKMMVLSNNKRDDYLQNAKTLLSMEVLGSAKKPFRSGFERALEVLEMPPHEVAAIGDRPLTDILGGQWAGTKTVLVKPLACIVEPSWKTFFRNLERTLARE
jgi:uncharacterized protein